MVIILSYNSHSRRLFFEAKWTHRLRVKQLSDSLRDSYLQHCREMIVSEPALPLRGWYFAVSIHVAVKAHWISCGISTTVTGVCSRAESMSLARYVWDEQREEGFPVCILWVYICFSARVQGGHWRKLSEEGTGTLWLWMLLLQLLYSWDIGERRRIPKNTGWEREGKAPIDETSLLLIILSGIAVWPQQ